MFSEDELFDALKHVLVMKIRIRPFYGFLAEWQTNFVSRRFAGGAAPRSFTVKKELSGYSISSLRLSYSPKISFRFKPTFSLAVENIFQRRVWERVDYYTLPTCVYTSIRISF